MRLAEAAVLVAGSEKAAAHRLGLSDSTVKLDRRVEHRVEDVVEALGMSAISRARGSTAGTLGIIRATCSGAR